LLRLLSDESFIPPGPVGDEFLDGLGESALPGIAAAARRRYELNVAAGTTSWIAAAGLFDLMARQGGSDEIAWLAARAESGLHRHDAREALVRSKSPLAVETVVRLLRQGKGDQELLVDFGRHHPTSANAIFRQVLTGELTVPYREPHAILRAYGASAPADDLDATRDLLFSLTDPVQRICAVYAVEQLRRRGLETTGFEPLVDAPVEHLERVTPGTRSSVTGKARYAISHNRIAWSERAARALDRAAGVLPQGSMTQDMQKIARKIRAGLASPWK
jgi:hypothetical protein